MDSELILLIHRNAGKYPNVIDQLDHDFDAASTPANNYGTPSMFVCTKPVWIEIEGALALRRKFDKNYSRVVTNHEKGGFNALIYRARPIVAMDAGNNNIINTRLTYNATTN